MPKILDRVIVIDDDYISLFFITKFLGEKKIAETILPFTNGTDALNYILTNAGSLLKLPELFLLDIKMPGLSGQGFLQELNKVEFIAGYEPAICIMSAETSIDFDLLESSPYIKGYLLKPIVPFKLSAVIESLTTKTKSCDMHKGIMESEVLFIS